MIRSPRFLLFTFKGSPWSAIRSSLWSGMLSSMIRQMGSPSSVGTERRQPWRLSSGDISAINSKWTPSSTVKWACFSYLTVKMTSPCFPQESRFPSPVKVIGVSSFVPANNSILNVFCSFLLLPLKRSIVSSFLQGFSRSSSETVRSFSITPFDGWKFALKTLSNYVNKIQSIDIIKKQKNTKYHFAEGACFYLRSYQ